MNCPINSERWNHQWRLEQRKSVKSSIFITIFLNIFQLKRQTLSNLKPLFTSPEFSYEWSNSVQFFSISDCAQKSKYIWVCPAFNYKRHLENSDKYLILFSVKFIKYHAHTFLFWLAYLGPDLSSVCTYFFHQEMTPAFLFSRPLSVL